MENKKKKDPLQIEIAQELGLLEKAEKDGWSSLTAAESGRIGGIMKARHRQAKQNP